MRMRFGGACIRIIGREVRAQELCIMDGCVCKRILEMTARCDIYWHGMRAERKQRGYSLAVAVDIEETFFFSKTLHISSTRVEFYSLSRQPVKTFTKVVLCTDHVF